MKLSQLVCLFAFISITAQAQVTVECEFRASDADNDGFGWENGDSCVVTDTSASAPVIFDALTGIRVDLERVEWKWEDLAGKTVNCHHEWINTCHNANYPVWGNFCQHPSSQRSWRYDFRPEGSLEIYAHSHTPVTEAGTWWLENGFIATSLGEQNISGQYIERNGENEFSIWERDDYRLTCQGAVPSERVTQLIIEDNTCIDTDPVGDGWGWNGSESCRVNDEASSIPTASACIDTDPVGDGWGWNGSESCRVNGEASSNPTTSVCTDTDPVDDGWGWDGEGSCIIEDHTPEETVCVDTPPLGNGWGWDGVSSCLVAPDYRVVPDGGARYSCQSNREYIFDPIGIVRSGDGDLIANYEISQDNVLLDVLGFGEAIVYTYRITGTSLVLQTINGGNVVLGSGDCYLQEGEALRGEQEPPAE